jgi:hypothetical protein
MLTNLALDKLIFELVRMANADKLELRIVIFGVTLLSHHGRYRAIAGDRFVCW